MIIFCGTCSGGFVEVWARADAMSEKGTKFRLVVNEGGMEKNTAMKEQAHTF